MLIFKRIKWEGKKLKVSKSTQWCLDELCLIEYPIMFISGGETYLKLIFEKENGHVDVVELPLELNKSFPCIQKSLQFSNEKHCVVFEKKRIPTGFLHGTSSYEYVFRNAYIKR